MHCPETPHLSKHHCPLEDHSASRECTRPKSLSWEVKGFFLFLNFSNEHDLSTEWLSRACRAQQRAQPCCTDNGQRGAELSPTVISPKTKHEEQYVSPKVCFEKLAGVRDMPSPALGVKFLCELSPKAAARAGPSTSPLPAPLCSQSWQEEPRPREEPDHKFYIKTPLPRSKCQSQINQNMYQQMKMWMKKFCPQQVLGRGNWDPQN